MDEVAAAVARVSDVLGQIDAAGREQSIGVGQVGEAVQQLDAITQQNAAMVEELAASASALNGQVGRVHDAIRVFRLTEQDKSLAEVDAVGLRKAGTIPP
jgi:aerotaxis receptor